MMGSEISVNCPDPKWQVTRTACIGVKIRPLGEVKMRRENESIILLIPHRGGNYRRENNQGRQNIQTAETSGLSNKAKHNIDLIQDGAGGYYRERKSGGDYPVPRWRWRLRRVEGREGRERLCPPPRWRQPWALSLAPPRGLGPASPLSFPPPRSQWPVWAEVFARGERAPGV